MGQSQFTYRSLTAAMLLAASGQSLAAGFAVPELSAAGLAMSNAVVANTREIGAIPYNASLAAFHDSATMSGTLMLLRPTLAATPTGGSYVESRGEENVLIPGTMGSLPLTDNMTAVLSVNAPFGLETVWEVGDFPGATSHLGGIAHPTTSRIEVIAVSPSLAFKINEATSVAVGVDYYWAREIVFDAVGQQNNGDGDGWGFNLSFTSKLNDTLTLGASYHSKSELDIKGSTNIPSLYTGPATAEPILPWRAQIGLHAQVSDKLGLEFDFSRTGWSSFSTLTIDSAFPTTSANNWKDTNAYRFGAEYALDERTRLRAGYTFDETGQPDEFFSARVPDSDRHLFSLGVGYDLGDGMSLDAGYMYVMFEDRTVASTTAPTTTELNGTTAFNGEYEADVHIFGVGLSKRF